MNAHGCEAGPMLERVSQCIFQLDKADTKISLEWGSRDTARGFSGTAWSYLQLACASGDSGRPAPATPLFSWRFPDIISAVKATIHFNVIHEQAGHTSILATLKPHQELENSYFNILTTTQ